MYVKAIPRLPYWPPLGYNYVTCVLQLMNSIFVLSSGQKAGYLGSAFFVGNFIGSFAWGWAADVFGRKPIMLTGLVFTILSELLFGFSQNFAWAVTARFLWGLLNGNLGIAKTYISEVCLATTMG